MRGKVAKALRRQARAATQGAPERAYLTRNHTRTKELSDGRHVKFTTQEQRLDPESTQGYYKQLKKEFKGR